jgi:hypothetical protein
MFDWTDLLLFLPDKVFWALVAFLCVLAAVLLIWTKFG